MSAILEERESKKGGERGFRLEVMESTNGFCHVFLRLLIDEANALLLTLRDKQTRKALSEAARSTGLDKALPSSWESITCMEGPFGGSPSEYNVILEEKEGTKGAGRGFRFEIMESTNGFCYVSLRLPIDQVNAFVPALRDKRTRDALCEAARSTGLDKALLGSWYCITCMAGPFGGSPSRHNVNEKAWFDAFLEGFSKCDGPAFAVESGRCPGT